MRATALALVATTLACGSPPAPERRRVDEVDVFVGSGGLGFGVGSIQPGPRRPFGMVHPGPDTSTNGGGAPGFSHCAGYWWEDDEIRGFSQLHLAGTGVPDLGVVMLMPTGALPDGPITPDDYRDRFDHRAERGTVGKYEVTLLERRIRVELAATERTALHRYTYPAGSPQAVVVDLAHGLGTGRTESAELAIDAAAREVRGRVHHRGGMSGSYGGFEVFFVMRFDRPFAAATPLEGGRRRPDVTALESPAAGALLAFDPAGGAAVTAQVGLSFIDLETARANLDEAWAGFDVERVVAASEAAWEALLSRVDVEGGDPVERTKFFTALFHSFFMPASYTEAGGRYRGIDGEVRRADGFVYYSDFSLWDTFRTLHPMLALLAPSLQRDMNASLMAMTEASGRVPKWPLATGETNVMIGYHGETVLADAHLRGVGGFDAGAAWQRFRAAAFPVEPEAPGRRRDCHRGYLERGYCGADEENGATSKTLENAFSDAVLARFARALGHEEDARALEARAGSWRTLADPEVRSVRARAAGGDFVEPFTEHRFTDDLVEGNARQWTTFVPHDVPGLAAALGGREAMVDVLERLFTLTAEAEDGPLPDPGYWHGNEPDIHAAYMFAELGRPDRTGHWVDWIRRTRYAASPAGLDGNDDGGTLSAWFGLSALGLHPKVGEAAFLLGPPLFPLARVRLEGGGVLTVRAENWTPGAWRVRSVTLDGVPVEGPTVSHAALARGGDLTFDLEAP